MYCKFDDISKCNYNIPNTYPCKYPKLSKYTI